MTDEMNVNNTEGGASISGDANVGQDFVGRDKTIYNNIDQEIIQGNKIVNIYPTAKPDNQEPILAKKLSRRYFPLWIFFGVVSFVSASLSYLIGSGDFRLGNTAPPSNLKVLVTNLDNSDAKEQYLFTEQLLNQLHRSLGQYQDVLVEFVNEKITEESGGSQQARKLGKKKQASIVIWGEYGVTSSNALLLIHIENLADYLVIPFPISDSYGVNAPIAEIKNFKVQQTTSQDLSAITLFVSGIIRFKAKDYKTALQRFTSAIELNQWPDDLITIAALYNYLGLTKSFLHDYEGAISNFSKAIESAPNLAEPYHNRGLVYGSLSYNTEYTNSVSSSVQPSGTAETMAIIWYPQYGNIYIKPHENAVMVGTSGIDAGVIYVNSFSEKAISDFTKAIHINPELAVAYFNRGVASEMIGSTQAISDYLKTVDIDPNFYAAFNNLGNTYMHPEYNKPEIALGYYNQAIKLNPMIPEYYMNRAMALDS